MSGARLAAGVEVSALLRLVDQQGGFGAVLHKGDATRGALLLVISERGVAVTCLARELTMSGIYAWARVGPGSAEAEPLRNFLEKRRRGDPDEWQIELDVPSAERFIAETTDLG